MSRRTRSHAAAALAIAALAATGSAPAAPAAEPFSHVGGLGPARDLESGLLEVRLPSGETISTHGLDGRQVSAPLATPGSRPPVCADVPHLRVLYGRPPFAPDRTATAVTAARSAIYAMNGAVDAAGVATGGRHADFRVRCDSGGQIPIDSFVNSRSNSLSDIIEAARAAGAIAADVDYLILYDDATPGVCGAATLYPDDRLAADNRNNRGTGYAMAYSDCWDAATILHEVAHAQGAVQPTSPHSTGSGGHCRDETDVMCYSDGGDRDTGVIERCAGGSRFDCSDDDYFDTKPEPGEWLDTRWNLGSPLNRFLYFSELQPGEDPATYGALTDLMCTTEGLLPPPPGGSTCADGEVEEEGDAPPEAIATGSVLRIRSLELRGRRLVLSLACPSGREADCDGRLRIADSRRRTLLRGWFSIPAGSVEALRMTPSRSVRQRLERARRAPRLRVIVDESDGTRTTRTLRLAR